jgi:uncharacterized protein (DUF983 family)
MLWRGLRRRCPRCGAGRLFYGWLAIREECPTCRYRFERPGEEGFFLGAIVVNFAVTEGVLGILLLVSFLLTLPDPPLLLLCAVAVPLMVVAPIAFYPFSKTIWAAFDLLMHPADDAGPVR